MYLFVINYCQSKYVLVRSGEIDINTDEFWMNHNKHTVCDTLCVSFERISMAARYIFLSPETILLIDCN